MTAEKLPPWARMSVGYDDDPKIVALARFGEDAGLCRDLHLAAIRYCRRNETDGLVPAEQMARLAWPIAPARAELLVAHLADVELLVAVDGESVAGAMANGWRVPNYERWQETADEIAAYSAAQSERGRLGATTRWTREKARRASYGGSMTSAAAGHVGDSMAGAMAGAIADAKPPPDDQATWHPDGEPIAEREKRETSSAHAGADARTREDAAAPDDDDDDSLANTIVALLHAHGPITRDQAAAYRDRVLAGRRTADPARYVVGAIRRDPVKAYREAITATAAAPRSSSRQPAPTGLLCRRCSRTDHRTEDCPTLDGGSAAAGDAEHGAALARKQLAERERPAAADEPPPDEPPDELPGQLVLEDQADEPVGADDEYPF